MSSALLTSSGRVFHSSTRVNTAKEYFHGSVRTATAKDTGGSTVQPLKKGRVGGKTSGAAEDLRMFTIGSAVQHNGSGGKEKTTVKLMLRTVTLTRL